MSGGGHPSAGSSRWPMHAWPRQPRVRQGMSVAAVSVWLLKDCLASDGVARPALPGRSLAAHFERTPRLLRQLDDCGFRRPWAPGSSQVRCSTGIGRKSPRAPTSSGRAPERSDAVGADRCSALFAPADRRARRRRDDSAADSSKARGTSHRMACVSIPWARKTMLTRIIESSLECSSGAGSVGMSSGLVDVPMAYNPTLSCSPLEALIFQ